MPKPYIDSAKTIKKRVVLRKSSTEVKLDEKDNMMLDRSHFQDS